MSELLSIPSNAATLLLRDGGVHLCPPLRSDEFVRFCNERGIAINDARLLRFERLGIFSPIFRVYPSNARARLRLPLVSSRWFGKGYALDTTRGQAHPIPENNGDAGEAYYSRFQMASLAFAISAFTAHLQLESLLESGDDFDEAAWLRRGRELQAFAGFHADQVGRADQFRPAIDLLCQHISDRYYPHARSNMRTRLVSNGGLKVDPWIAINGMNWKWRDYALSWDAEGVERAFDLTPAKLRHAYSALSHQQSGEDPLARWYQLVQFVGPSERDRLKGDALAAETMRGGAIMLRLLYRDLYSEELPHPNEVGMTIITHAPELNARADARRHLEFVVNRFDLNPSPKLTLFVEGPSEEVMVRAIFERYFGAAAGTHQIEIIDLGGVDTATGGKRFDRFRAILRLVDYLHHHQTFTFLILDNENYARKLKAEARSLASKLHSNRYTTRPDYIKIWRVALEFDNFSNTEIASGLSTVANGAARFTTSDVAACRKSANPRKALSDLYAERTAAGLNKIELARELIGTMFDAASRTKITNRPLIKTLERVVRLAARNPFPTTESSWERNQVSSYLGKTRTRVRHKRRTSRGSKRTSPDKSE